MLAYVLEKLNVANQKASVASGFCIVARPEPPCLRTKQANHISATHARWLTQPSPELGGVGGGGWGRHAARTRLKTPD